MTYLQPTDRPTYSSPRVRYDGIHIIGGEELAERADVCLMAASDVEFKYALRTINHFEELTHTGYLKILGAGFHGDVNRPGISDHGLNKMRTWKNKCLDKAKL